MKKNQSQVQGKETTLGERPIRIYIYEALNRLIHATGKAKNASYDMAMTFGRMSEPLTKIQKVDSTTTAKSYEIISRMMSQDPYGNKDHADLKDNNQSNIGVVNYLNTMKEMGLTPPKNK